ADDVHHAPESGLAHRNADRSARVLGAHAAHHSIGGLHGDAADAPFPEVLLDLDDDVDGRRHFETFARNPQRVVDGGLLAFLELDVHGGTDDLQDFAGFRHDAVFFLPNSGQALAPLTTSMISRVIAACRMRFMFSVSVSIIS